MRIAKEITAEPVLTSIPSPSPTTYQTPDLGGVVAGSSCPEPAGNSPAAPQHLVATPYGYVLTHPASNTRISVIEIEEGTDETGQKYLTGRVKNDNSEEIDHITLQFNLYNIDGYLIGNTYASANSLGSQKTWKFTTQPFPSRDYHHYELTKIFIA